MHLVRIGVWIVTAIVCAILFFWFSQTFRGRPFVQESVEDATRSNRLELVYVPVGFSLSSKQGYDFHSIVWKTNDGSGWGTRRQILAAEIATGSAHGRWVSGVQSIDGVNGTAILKIAESFSPTNSPMIVFDYSWREWSLVTNAQVRMIRVCANPFEGF